MDHSGKIAIDAVGSVVGGAFASPLFASSPLTQFLKSAIIKPMPHTEADIARLTTTACTIYQVIRKSFHAIAALLSIVDLGGEYVEFLSSIVDCPLLMTSTAAVTSFCRESDPRCMPRWLLDVR